MSDEKIEAPGDQARDTLMQNYIKHVLQQAHIMVFSTSAELKLSGGEASAVVLSILSTSLMIYIRGYPKELHYEMFHNVGEYFERMAQEAEVKGDDNDRSTKPAN